MYICSDPNARPNVNVEVFHMSVNETGFDGPGWYWWACFPGCLPDGEPNGPYTSQAEAVEAAQKDQEDV